MEVASCSFVTSSRCTYLKLLKDQRWGKDVKNMQTTGLWGRVHVAAKNLNPVAAKHWTTKGSSQK
jgi:hypothetical protein